MQKWVDLRLKAKKSTPRGQLYWECAITKIEERIIGLPTTELINIDWRRENVWRYNS
jgi:hypothetical protein